MNNRILVIINTIDAGGAETFVMKLFRCIKDKGYVFDFLINKPNSDFYEKEIISYGGKIYRGYSKSQHLLKSLNFLYKTVKVGKYRSVFYVTAHPLGSIDILIARLAGAKKIYTRSTNASNSSFKSKLLAPFFRPFMRLLSSVFIAPSKEAATWLFGKKVVKRGKVHILKNGLVIDNYIYSLETRKKYRNKFGIDDKFVVGHIGRFCHQKNHEKLLHVFNAITQIKHNAILILVGEGELKNKIELLAAELGIRDKVIFLGIRRDISELLQSFDAFVFPSYYEGLPNTIIEVQTAALPCVLSDSISKEVLIGSNIKMMGLYESDEKWAEEIVALSKMDRKDIREEIKASGYSIEDTAKRFLKIINGTF